MIPSQTSINLNSMKFDDFSLDPDQMLTASVRMFLDCGLIEEFNIDYQVFIFAYCLINKQDGLYTAMYTVYYN